MTLGRMPLSTHQSTSPSPLTPRPLGAPSCQVTQRQHTQRPRDACQHAQRRTAMLVSVLMVAGVFCLTSWAVAAPHETKITELAPGVYFRKAQTEPKFTGCNQGWVVFKDFVLIIDANFPGQAPEVIEAIRQRTDKPIRFVFDTHYHGDHADGNPQYVKLGATIIAHERSQPLFQTKGLDGFTNAQQDAERQAEYGSLSYAIPSLYFSHKLIFDDGEQRVELMFLGHAHTAGDAVAWFPRHGILFTGDACVNGAFNYTGDSNTESWIAALSGMQELGPKQVAPGHGELADGDLIATQKRYFTELREAVRTGMQANKTLDQIKEEIDLPFYKEWTGVEAKSRVENIEHVYGELKGAAQPLSQSVPFQKWLAGMEGLSYGPTLGWNELGTHGLDQQFSELAEMYLTADSHRRKQIRDFFAQRPQELDAMWLFVRRAGKMIESPDDVHWLRRGLAIAAIEGGRSDYRDSIVSLVLLRHGGERVGMQVDPLFRQIEQGEFVAPENKPLFENARTHAAADVAATIRAFGPADWIAAVDGEP